MQQGSKVILFLREGRFAARAKRVRKSAEKKKDTLLTRCIQNFFEARNFRFSTLSKFENFLLCEPVDL
jgi:hypothetical protein